RKGHIPILSPAERSVVPEHATKMFITVRPQDVVVVEGRGSAQTRLRRDIGLGAEFQIPMDRRLGPAPERLDIGSEPAGSLAAGSSRDTGPRSRSGSRKARRSWEGRTRSGTSAKISSRS